MKHFILDGYDLTVKDVVELAGNPRATVEIHADARARMRASRRLLDELIDSGETIYGVNTNMGGMVKWLIPDSQVATIQNNLIRAVASNVGEVFDDLSVRTSMLCRINSLVRGNSAVSEGLVDLLVKMFNHGITPLVPQLGSLGTSGDLGPLAAIALVIIGEGHARVDGQIMSGTEALARHSLEPAKLSYKDGLALINGTSFMTGVMAIALTRARTLFNNYYAISALTFGCLNARKKPINPIVHRLKGHAGQLRVAESLYALLEEMDGVVDDKDVSQRLHAERIDRPTEGSVPVEDPYSLRCTPQILGPVLDCLDQIESCLEKEINSSSDNPLIEINSEEVFHCGHFHGQYIAMAADQLKIAVTTLANLAERRIDRLLDSKKNGCLPPFLARENAGVRLGLMGAQFMSSSVTAEMRCASTPMSIQSLPTTADFQDNVSMGLVAARQALALTEKCAYVVGCELFLGCQVIDLKELRRQPPAVAELYQRLRRQHPFLDRDRSLTDELDSAMALVLNNTHEPHALQAPREALAVD